MYQAFFKNPFDYQHLPFARYCFRSEDCYNRKEPVPDLKMFIIWYGRETKM